MEESAVSLGNDFDDISTIRGFDPMAGAPALTEGAVSRVARHAMVHERRPWTRRRFRLVTLSAALGSGAAITACVLGLSAAATPDLPILAIGKGSRGADALPMIPDIKYVFT